MNLPFQLRRRSTAELLLSRLRSFHELHGMRRVLTSNYAYVLLTFVPLGILSGIFDWHPTIVFAFNILAIVPLAMLMSFATDELSVDAGQTVGSLLNATFGNAVEMIVCRFPNFF
jgi:Ca2+:H+ antiporter